MSSSCLSVLREKYAVRVRSPGFANAAVSRSSSSQQPQLTSGNSLVLRCEVSRSTLASHLAVDSWKNLKTGRVISVPVFHTLYRGKYYYVHVSH